jgi:hypothetical protein
MKIQKWLIPCLLVLTAACGKIENDLSGNTPYNPTVMEKARQTYCGKNNKLVEKGGGTSIAFEKMGDVNRVFAFGTGGKELCAVTNNISQSYNDARGTMWFTMNIHTPCIGNNTLWQLLDSHRSGSTHTYTLREITEDNNEFDNQQLEMSGTVGLNGDVAKNLAHLKVMTCE